MSQSTRNLSRSTHGGELVAREVELDEPVASGATAVKVELAVFTCMAGAPSPCFPLPLHAPGASHLPTQPVNMPRQRKMFPNIEEVDLYRFLKI